MLYVWVDILMVFVCRLLNPYNLKRYLHAFDYICKLVKILTFIVMFGFLLLNKGKVPIFNDLLHL